MFATLNFQGKAQHVDFNLLHFYLWEHLKALVYSAAIENEQAPHQRIFDPCQTICNCHMTYERVPQSMVRCVHMCTESGVGHFEQMLWSMAW